MTTTEATSQQPITELKRGQYADPCGYVWQVSVQNDTARLIGHQEHYEQASTMALPIDVVQQSHGPLLCAHKYGPMDSCPGCDAEDADEPTYRCTACGQTVRVIDQPTHADQHPTEAEHADQQLADEQAAGLRAIADAIQAHPEIARLVRFSLSYITGHVFNDERDSFATFARAMKEHGGDVRKDYSSAYAKVLAHFGPVVVGLQAERESVCERVVVGTQTVTKTVKDPELLAAVPEVEVTEEVEVVEWQCRPLLAAGDAS